MVTKFPPLSVNDSITWRGNKEQNGNIDRSEASSKRRRDTRVSLRAFREKNPLVLGKTVSPMISSLAQLPILFFFSLLFFLFLLLERDGRVDRRERVS